MKPLNKDDLEWLTARYGAFVNLTHEGRVPYRWQTRLMLHVAQSGHWPNRVCAPTGAGKTCVIGIHVFLNACAGMDRFKDTPLMRLPRRLALTVNRRTLVDSQYGEAENLRRYMVEDSALDEYRQGLESRSGGFTPALIVAELRGGVTPPREWRYHPTACAILCATPDMFGSRLLFRGYGTSRTMRGMEAGLLAYDTILVADEAHLSRQLLLTARQVERIESYADHPTSRMVTPLQVVETTATPTGEDDGDSIGVTPADLNDEPRLNAILNARKPFTVELADSEKQQVGRIVEETVKHIRECEDESVVGVILNTVKKAETVARLVSKQCAKLDMQRPILTLVGPMRGVDKNRIGRLLSHLDETNDDTPCCIIGTQTLEVGVDADFSHMVTEPASASTLLQRAGRVNRHGLYEDPSISIIGVNTIGMSDGMMEKTCRPYKTHDVKTAIEWLDHLNGNINPMSVKLDPPEQTPERPILERLEQWNVENLSHTDETLCAQSDDPNLLQGMESVDIWLRDSLSDEFDMNLMVRHLPDDDALAMQLLEAMPPSDDELFPLYYRSNVERAAELGNRAFVYHADSRPHVALYEKDMDVRPGDTLIIDDTVPLFTQLPDGALLFSPDGNTPGDDVSDQAEKTFHAIRSSDLPNLDSMFEQVEQEQDETGTAFQSIMQATQFDSPDASLVWHGRDMDGTIWLVVSTARQADQEIKSTHTATYLLGGGMAENRSEGHQDHVADRAQRFASTVGLDAQTSMTLYYAGLHHDEGKKDMRFQTLLHDGVTPTGEPWAKSRTRIPLLKERRLRAQLGLEGWRHEQLSVACFLNECDTNPQLSDMPTPMRGMIARLIGTSHGHGRSMFMQDSRQLTHGQSTSDARLNDTIVSLYDTGTWQTLMEDTSQQAGYWGAAYLEALLRAADITCSKEGL